MTTGSPTPNHDELMDQLWDYLQGELAPEQAESFEAALRNSPETIQAGVDLIEVMVMAREICRREGEARKELFLGASPEHRLDDVISAVTDPHAHANKTTLADLQELDEDAQPQPPIHIDANVLTKQKYASALSYVLRHTFTPKRLIAGGVAAALLLGTVLAVVLMTGPDAPEQIVGHPTESGSHGPDTPVAPSAVVATLTATHNAAWSQDGSERALASGSQLHAGDRLTLTAGFAEITTNRGAVAILEAPATIELLGSNNALRLVRGKLVGICETESSKGFVVQTDHAQITDIGTEFGVDVSVGGLTRLHVFRGEVRVAVKDQQGQAGEALPLLIGQAVHISADAGLFAVVLDADRFAGHRGYKLAGQIKESFESSLSLAPGDTESSDFMLLVPERKSVRLDQPLQILMPTDTPSPNHQHAQKTLDTGTRVDSYLIHFDSAESSDGSETLTLQGEVRFNRPILGLILDNKQLHDASALLGGAGVQYTSPDAQVGTENWGDQVTVSPDGKTLRLSLSAKLTSELGIDQVRVLVHAE